MAKKTASRKIYIKRMRLKSNASSKIIKISKKELRTLLRHRLNPSKKIEDVQKEANPAKRSSFLQSIQVHDLTCSICMHILLMPFTLRCGHIFCFHCLDTLSQHESVCDSCPCCRASIGDNYPSRNRIIENMLPYLVKQKLTSEERSEYTSRKLKMLEEFEKRAEENKTIAMGQKIDFKVGNHWQVGTVVKIYQKESKTKVEVQSAYSQIIYVFSRSSTHLAPFATFSKRYTLDIEDYLDLDLSPLSISISYQGIQLVQWAQRRQSAVLNTQITSFQQLHDQQRYASLTVNDNLA